MYIIGRCQSEYLIIDKHTMPLLFWLAFFAILYIIHKRYTKLPKLNLNKDSVVLITGACNGIGKQTAE
jgi:hypothetical protein